MAKVCKVTVNGQAFAANLGDILLDAALVNGVDIPHDCRSGQCGTCIVRLLSGRTLAGEGTAPGTVHACQARVFSDLQVAFEHVPVVSSCCGEVVAVHQLSWDVSEVVIAPKRSIPYLPGQYLKVRYKGFPARAYSPTVALDPPLDDGTIRFHVRRLSGGCVSSRLGTHIRAGHSVRLRGPFGSAYFRRGQINRIILVAGGTGFGPMWSIADAALREYCGRPIALVVGVRAIQSLYMARALEHLSVLRNVAIFVATEEPQTFSSAIQTGRPSDFLPSLLPDDLVYAAGPQGLVETVRTLAAGVQAEFYADPFVANGAGESRWFQRLMLWRKPTPPPARTARVGLGRILRDLEQPELTPQAVYRAPT